ncbi:MAG: phosphoglycerate kinase, partial [bacterium]
TAAADARATVKSVERLDPDDRILDIGPATIAAFTRIIETAGTIVWNGPAGLFEIPQFARGTEMLGRAIAAADAFSVAGGGDTLAAVERFDLSAGLSCISTGGGAFLEFLQGKPLPAVTALATRATTTK